MVPLAASRRRVTRRTDSQVPNSQPATATALPIELIFSILEEAQYDDLIPRYKWIKGYTLVCQAWRNHAQQMLYASVAIHKGTDQCKAFKNALAAARCRDVEHAMVLGAAVRTLSWSSL